MSNKIIYLDYTFENVEIKSGTVGQEESLDISTLGVDTFDAVVKCPDRSITVFEQNTPLTWEHKGRQAGIFYVQSINRVGRDKYAISAISSVGRLTQRQHYGGIYTGQTVAAVVSNICGDIPFIVKTNLAGIKLYGWLPIAPARDNLAQVLFAIGANLATDNNGVLRVENLWNGVSGVIDADHIYLGGSVNYDTPVTSVTVLEHQYVEGGEEAKLFKGTTTEGQIITFAAPMYDLVPDGFSVLENGANYAVVSPGSGTLTGRAYVHTTREVTRPVSTASIANEKRVEKATLVSLANSSAVANRLAEYFSHRETVSVDAVVNKGQKPGQVVALYHPYDREMIRACIAEGNINVSNTLKSNVKALAGFQPPQTEQEYYDTRILLTGSGTWTVPEGVTQVTAVLIGKGYQGEPGADGEAGKTHSIIQDGSGTWSVSAKAGGAGGAPGAGGQGGKIFRSDVTTSAGTQFAYDATGQDTTFGSLSSANGASSATGYTDPVTGDVYAQQGDTGTAGAAGGSGTNYDAADYGNPGEDIGNYRGGSGSPRSMGTGGTSGSIGYYGGAGGGGAAIGANGKIGGTGRSNSGGPGGDARAPAQAEGIGAGGTGGNGGGGGGGTGGATITSSSGMGAWYSVRSGPGGKGSLGGEGALGCIILYYRTPNPQRTGAPMEKKSRLRIDRTGRICVV